MSEVKNAAKEAAQAERNKLISELVGLGMEEADIGSAWSENRLKTEITQLKAVQARKAARSGKPAKAPKKAEAADE